MNKPVPLYSSAEVHTCIKKIFGQPSKGDKRVALVAYVGSDGECYLPHPHGLRIICNPSAGGTDPDTLRQLIKHHAKVEISDNLHMKVYWSRNRGCIITSANASSNALGRNGLKEMGIFLPAGMININRLIRYAHPREAQESDLRRLDNRAREFNKNIRANRKLKRAASDFLKWYSAPHRSNWKMTWADYEVSGTASAVKEQTALEYGHREPHTWVSVGANRVRRNDWLLSLTFSEKGIKSVHWQYVDFVVKIHVKEKRYYQRDWPYHAVQVNSSSKCQVPPFQITTQFRKALSNAIKTYTLERIKKAKTDKPPVRLLNLLAKELKSH